MSKLVYGIGFNSRGKYKATIGGKRTKSYTTWLNMLQRTYYLKYHVINPTYLGCSVSNEWLEYQVFAEWFSNHEYSNHGYQLDKDLLLPGNKIYSPDTCCFVPRQLNTLILDSGATRGDYPQGVSFHKASNKFRADVKVDGGQKGLGLFDTEQEAYNAYKVVKEANIKRMALEWQDRIADNVFNALMRWELDPK